LVSRCTRQQQPIRLWCAGVNHTDIPACLQQEVLTTPLRFSPAVLREVSTGLSTFSTAVYAYSNSGLPAHGDGQKVIRLHHAGESHEGRWPVDCPTCGEKVATQLKTLGVGAAGES